MLFCRVAPALRFAAVCLLVVGVRSTEGQTSRGAGASGRASSGPGEIRGRLLEAGSGRAIVGGSVTVRRAADTTFAGGTLPGPDGAFRVDGLALGRYTVRVRSLGFAPLVRGDVVISTTDPVVELGTLELSPVATTLEAQTVTAERSEVTLSPDRSSYSTKNMTVASGGTAVDVLRNVPSVEVDGNNNVTLRGNTNVVVQINGRSSPLTGEQLGQFLTQLPASAVTRVEVATNPSAKNDPEGTAGIINIVLNQDASMGLSGGLTAGTGTTGMVNVSGNLGRQSGPLTLFLSGSVFRDRRTVKGFGDRTNLAVAEPAFVESRFGGSMHPRFGSTTFRSEYRFTQRDALSADAVISGGRFAREMSSLYTDLDAARDVIALSDQLTQQISRSLSQDYTLAFRRTVESSAPVLTTELRYNTNRWASDNDLAATSQPDNSSPTVVSREHNESVARMPAWNLQTDYTHAFGKRTKLESGFKGTQRRNEHDLAAAFLDPASGAYVEDPGRANAFTYRETIGAVYGVLSHQIGKAQTQAGLRLEDTRTRFTSAGDRFDSRYASAFPSAIVSYNITPMRQAKLSYSRRVTRPNPFQLSPIPWREDSRHEFRGNPALQPEYTDAIELGFTETRGWGSLQLNPYLRRTANAVRYFQFVDDDGISIATFDNVASNQTVGADLNVNYRRGPISLFGGASAWRYTSDAANLGGNLSTRATIWSARANVTWKLSRRTDGQLFTNYRAPSATEGGSQTAFAMINFAIRHKLWGEQGSVSLRISDPFSTMAFGYRSADGRVIELSERRFGQRGLFLTLSRNFGQQLKLQPRQQEGEPQPQQPGPP
jgi:outer membrane receptor protein involved in Fe transport